MSQLLGLLLPFDAYGDTAHPGARPQVTYDGWPDQAFGGEHDQWSLTDLLWDPNLPDTLFNVSLEPEESLLPAVSATGLQPLGVPDSCQISCTPTASPSAACTHPAPGTSDSRRPLGRVGNAQRAAQTPCKCRVPGCESILATDHVGEGNTATAASYYSRRLRVCAHHRKAALVPWPDGEPKRWCQKCARFESVDAFRGGNRACERTLTAQKTRVRQRRAAGQNAMSETNGATHNGSMASSQLMPPPDHAVPMQSYTDWMRTLSFMFPDP